MLYNRLLTAKIEAKAPYSWQGDTMNSPYVSRALNCQGANSEFVKIVGGTVGWNQLCGTTSSTATSHGITIKRNTDGTTEISGTADASGFAGNLSQSAVSLPGHKFLIRGCSSGGSASTYYLRDGYTASADRFDTGNGNIINGLANTILQLVIKPNYAISGTLVFKSQLIDLTAFLGPTIADYAYTLEQQSAGSGVSWLKQYGFFLDDYYPFATSKLESVQTSAHVIKDANDQTVESYAIDDVVLRGIPKLVNGEIQYDGDTYEADGTVTRYWKEVDLGDLTWTYRSEIAAGMFSGTISGNKAGNTLYAICSKYEYAGAVGGIALAHAKDKTLSLYTGGGVVYVYDTAYTSKAAFEAAVAGEKLLVELATPTTESADPFTNPITIDPNGSEEWVDAGTRDFEMPVGNETSYAGLYPDLGLSPLGLKAVISVVDPFV